MLQSVLHVVTEGTFKKLQEVQLASLLIAGNSQPCRRHNMYFVQNFQA